MSPVEATQNMRGLEMLQAMIRGEIPHPPIAHLLGYQLEEIAEGRAVVGVQPAEYHYNPIGSVHGGLAATVLDTALGCAVHSVMPLGASYTTIELKINYIRPVTVETGYLRCEAMLIHAGRRMATAEGRLVDDNGKLYAHGSTTCMVFDAQSET